MAQVLIQGPKGSDGNPGPQFEIARSAFTKKDLFRTDDGDLVSYEAAKFTIVSNADGTPIDEPRPAARAAAEKPEAAAASPKSEGKP